MAQVAKPSRFLPSAAPGPLASSEVKRKPPPSREEEVEEELTWF